MRYMAAFWARLALPPPAAHCAREAVHDPGPATDFTGYPAVIRAKLTLAPLASRRFSIAAIAPLYFPRPACLATGARWGFTGPCRDFQHFPLPGPCMLLPGAFSGALTAHKPARPGMPPCGAVLPGYPMSRVSHAHAPPIKMARSPRSKQGMSVTRRRTQAAGRQSPGSGAEASCAPTLACRIQPQTEQRAEKCRRAHAKAGHRLPAVDDEHVRQHSRPLGPILTSAAWRTRLRGRQAATGQGVTRRGGFQRRERISGRTPLKLSALPGSAEGWKIWSENRLPGPFHVRSSHFHDGIFQERFSWGHVHT